MPPETSSDPVTFEFIALETLIASLRTAHAMEKQVILVLDGQLRLLAGFPDLNARLSAHISDFREQARRLEACLEACGSSSSLVKVALLSVMGLGQSSLQGFTEDAALKVVIANIMTEHLEIATYRALLELADLAGKPDLRPRLEISLREEVAMADWLSENLASITRRFVEIKTADRQQSETAKQARQTNAAGKAAADPQADADRITQNDVGSTEGATYQPLKETVGPVPAEGAYPIPTGEPGLDISTDVVTAKPTPATDDITDREPEMASTPRPGDPARSAS